MFILYRTGFSVLLFFHFISGALAAGKTVMVAIQGCQAPFMLFAEFCLPVELISDYIYGQF